MSYSAYLRDKLAAQITEATHISLHEDDPGETGDHEISGGSPAYARVALGSWTTADIGIKEAVPASVINVPANTDVLWAGLWNGSAFIDKAPCLISTVEQQAVTIDVIRFVVPEAG